MSDKPTTITQLEDVILGGEVLAWCKSVLKRAEYPIKLQSVNNLFECKFSGYNFREQVLLFGAMNYCMCEVMGKLKAEQFNHVTTITAKMYLTIIKEEAI